MLTYKHILVTTDLSPETEKVIDHAKTIAHRSGAKISLVHVLEHTPLVYGGGEFSIPLDINIEDALKLHAKQLMQKLGQKVGIIEQDQYIETGSIKKAIIDLVDRLKVDLIVVGTHGHHGFTMMLGSTANAILHSAKCDVLTVRVYD